MKHVEIAGGGIAGLSLAMMLARSGWSVRVHERSAETRESGAGIYLRNNSLKVLEEFGLLMTWRRAGRESETGEFATATADFCRTRTILAIPGCMSFRAKP